MKIIKLILLSLFVFLGSQTLIEAQEDNLKSILENKSRSKLRELLEKSDVQQKCFKDPETCKQIIIDSYGFRASQKRVNTKYLKILSVQQLLQLFIKQKLRQYLKLKSQQVQLIKNYNQQLENFADTGYDTETDLAPVMENFKEKIEAIEEQIDELLKK